MEIREHIVDFDTYCQNCKFLDKEDWKDPCHTCLNIPTNTNSRRPLYFEQREFTKKEIRELKKNKKKG